MKLFDIIGPVMTGPSSSHTAGAVKIGLVSRALLGSTPARAEILLHGSFAQTGRGHGTERGFRIAMDYMGNTVHFDATNTKATEYVWAKAKKKY